MMLAAIDIGSNAIRLLIMEVTTLKDGEVRYHKVNFLRVPLRLGMDVFEKGIISEAKTADIMSAMTEFVALMRRYRVSRYRACATSAMRDAKNGPEVTRAIQVESGIAVEIISGDQEADILYDTLVAALPDSGRPRLFIDVGGGSTEITVSRPQETAVRQSFNIGTIRLMQGAVSDAEMDGLKNFVKTRTQGLENIRAIGTGGNIHKLHSLAKLKGSRPISLTRLKAFMRDMGKLSEAERMERYHLRADRADVIVPALGIYCSILRWADIEEIYVPKIGLAEGLIRSLYLQYGPDRR